MGKTVKYLALMLITLLTYSYAHENWDGEYYNENSNIQYQWATSFLKKIDKDLTGNILDIGCGDGKITYEIAKAHPNCKVIGIDLSDSMIQLAKEKYSLENLEFMVGDAQSLKFNENFDSIVSFSCFHWIKDHDSALKSIFNILNTKGKVCLFFAAKNNAKDRLDQFIKEVLLKERWNSLLKVFKQDFNMVNTSGFKNRLVKANLKPIRVEEVKTHFVFKNKIHFRSWMKGWFPKAKTMSNKSFEQFIDEIIEKYITKHPLDNKGRFHYYDYMMEVVAEKSSEDAK